LRKLQAVSKYLASIVTITVLTVLMLPFRAHVNSTTVSLGFLLGVLLIATLYGSRAALVASLLAAFAFNFFFLSPYYTLTIYEPEDWVAVMVFLIVALTVGQLSATAKRRAEVAEKLYGDLQIAFEQASEAEAVKRSEKLKSALLDAVTHDLRTPLTSIKAATTMLIQEQTAVHTTLQPEAQTDLLQVIDEETDRLNAFIESMVEMAQLESGAMTKDMAQVDVSELVANVLQRAADRTKGREVLVEIDPAVHFVRGDEKALAEALFNLVDNAVKYSPDGADIHIMAASEANVTSIAVEDEGRGVRMSERERIFEKFHRGKESARGFGLGLAIVRGIVEGHGGRVYVEDGHHGGARFVIELKDEA
jgi:two-component system sensor histidine kinase KdpD